MPINRVQVDPKLASEVVPRTVDFIGKLPLGVTITAANVVASVWSGNDPAAGSIILGPASINGTQVTQRLTGGVAGCIYELLWIAVGSDNNSYRYSAYFAVVPDLP